MLTTLFMTWVIFDCSFTTVKTFFYPQTCYVNAGYYLKLKETKKKHHKPCLNISVLRWGKQFYYTEHSFYSFYFLSLATLLLNNNNNNNVGKLL